MRVALLGLALVLSIVAGLGVAGLYSARQDYEDRLADGYALQASAGRLLAAGVVAQAAKATPQAPQAPRAVAAELPHAPPPARGDTPREHLPAPPPPGGTAARSAP